MSKRKIINICYCEECGKFINGEDDSELLREWYELDDFEKAEWLENHPKF